MDKTLFEELGIEDFDELEEQKAIDAEGPDGTGEEPHPMGPWGKKPTTDATDDPNWIGEEN